MSQVLQNTYYGPAPQKTEAGTTQIDNQTQGSLTSIVQQPSEHACQNNGDTVTLVEKFKGPFTVLRELPNTTFKPNTPRQTAISSISTVLVNRFNPPSAGTNHYWSILNSDCRELTAGDHAELTVTYVSVPNATIEYEVIDRECSWSLQWQSYTMSPYGFCSPGLEVDRPAKNWEDKRNTDRAYRMNIEKYLQSGDGFALKQNGVYKPDNSKVDLHLTAVEWEIMSKIANSKNALYHYPIITKTTVVNQKPNSSYKDDIGNDLDCIVDLPDDCPYNFALLPYLQTHEDTDWKWLKVADNMSLDRKTSNDTIWRFTRQEQWIGAVSWDPNFYSPDPYNRQTLTGRFLIGAM